MVVLILLRVQPLLLLSPLLRQTRHVRLATLLLHVQVLFLLLIVQALPRLIVQALQRLHSPIHDPASPQPCSRIRVRAGLLIQGVLPLLPLLQEAAHLRPIVPLPLLQEVAHLRPIVLHPLLQRSSLRTVVSVALHSAEAAVAADPMVVAAVVLPPAVAVEAVPRQGDKRL